MHNVVVVGGGVVGASVAHRCVLLGARTLLVDAHDPGRATDAGAGIVSPETELRDGSPSHDLAQATIAFYPELIAALHADGVTDTGYTRCGKLMIARDEREAGWLGAYLDLLLDPGRPGAVPDGITEIAPETARERFPPLGPVTRAAWSANAARVDGRRLTRALLDASVARGLELEHATIDRISRVGSSLRAVAGDRRFDAERVVIAGGAWSAKLAATVGVKLDVYPQRGQIAHLAIDDPAVGDWPVVTPLSDHYLLAFPGRVVAGATHEDDAGFDARVTAAGTAKVLHDALGVAPGLADASLLETRAGLRPVARRGHPYLGAAPGVAGLFVAVGHGASGLTYGPWSGAQVADAALGEPHADLTRFAP